MSSPITSVNSSADLQTVDHPSIPQDDRGRGVGDHPPRRLRTRCRTGQGRVSLRPAVGGRGGEVPRSDHPRLRRRDDRGPADASDRALRHAHARPSVRECRLCGGGVPGARRPGMFDRPVDRRHQQRRGVARRHQRGARPVHHDGRYHDVRRRLLLLAPQRRSLRGGHDRRGVPRRPGPAPGRAHRRGDRR